MLMAYVPPDWHREDIKGAIRKTGITLSDLSRQHGCTNNAVRMTLIRPWPRVQAIIAAHLGKSPQEIWPSRYDHLGNPLRSRAPRTDKQDTGATTVTHRNLEDDA